MQMRACETYVLLKRSQRAGEVRALDAQVDKAVGRPLEVLVELLRVDGVTEYIYKCMYKCAQYAWT